MATTRDGQKDETRLALIAAARRRFASVGYADVSLADIVADVGVTKGALYHQFASKLALFSAVVEDVHREVGERIATAAGQHDDPWPQLLAGCREFLRASTARDVVRIMLVDGLAVLGLAAWRKIDDATSVRYLAEGLTALMEAGRIAHQPIEPLTRLVSGALNDAALWLVGRRNKTRDLDDVMAALQRMLEGLLD